MKATLPQTPSGARCSFLCMSGVRVERNRNNRGLDGTSFVAGRTFISSPYSSKSSWDWPVQHNFTTLKLSSCDGVAKSCLAVMVLDAVAVASIAETSKRGLLILGGR